MKHPKMYAIRAIRGKTHRSVIHIELHAGRKGTGRRIATHTCMDTDRDFTAAVLELLKHVAEKNGISASYVRNCTHRSFCARVPQAYCF